MFNDIGNTNEIRNLTAFTTAENVKNGLKRENSNLHTVIREETESVNRELHRVNRKIERFENKRLKLQNKIIRVKSEREKIIM